MKKASLVACVLLLVAAAGFAEVPGSTALSSQALAAILGQSVAGGSCVAQPGGMFLATPPPQHTSATCTAVCASGAAG